MAQLVERPTSAQVMISRSVSSSPASGSALTAQSLEPVSDSVSPSLSDPLLFMLCLCLKNKTLKKIFFLLNILICSTFHPSPYLVYTASHILDQCKSLTPTAFEKRARVSL